MQYATPDDTWTGWLAANQGRDDTTMLAALREIITETARFWVASGDISAGWANKKLAKLGIADRLDHKTYYELETTVVAPLKMGVYASSRAGAKAEFKARIARAAVTVSEAEAPYALRFVSGPEDIPQAGDPDAPTTVDATLEMLREIILLGNISGPRFNCDSGANRVLASYGLAPVPPRTEYVVVQPMQGTMQTVVEAYDEASAQRVAGWRWENNRSGFEVAAVTSTGDLAVVVE